MNNICETTKASQSECVVIAMVQQKARHIRKNTHLDRETRTNEAIDK